MKFKAIIFSVFIVFTYHNQLTAQGVAINEDNSTAHSSAMLDVKSITKGVLIPRMTTAERTAIAGAAEGLLVYDRTSGTYWYHNGISWVEQTTENTDNVNDADFDPNNEIQVLSISGNQITLSNGGGSITLTGGGADTDWTISGLDQYSGVSGNVGIGTTVPYAKLEVVQDLTNSSAAITAINSGAGYREAILGYTLPSGNADPVSVYGISFDPSNIGFGMGVVGQGGYFGVYGADLGNFNGAYGVFASGDLGATGVKTFVIDYPLDPANKTLRHYAVESNEITNMYRGIAQLDGNGNAIIELPEYFEAVNKNPSYQLTSIGSSTQPYVAQEIANNQFKVSGAPNAKVSWVVYGERNDPTIQWYDKNGKNYGAEVIEKTGKFKGLYYTPQAYDQSEKLGIHYQPSMQDQLQKKQ